MEDNSIDRIRSTTFTIARRGYDTREVERFLGKIADWLETGGEDEARADLVRRELERVGQRTADILATAGESAEQLRAEAQDESAATIESARVDAARTRQDADAYSEKTRKGADQYSAKTRGEADAYSKTTRDAADAYAEQTRAKAEADARQKRGEASEQADQTVAAAEAKAQRIVGDGVKRRRDIESVIGDLVDNRDSLITEATRLADELRGVAAGHTPIDGEDPFDVPSELDPEERVKARARSR